MSSSVAQASCQPGTKFGEMSAEKHSCPSWGMGLPSYDATHLWWPSFGSLYDDLSHPMKTSIEDVGKVLQVNRHKLLRVLSFFRPPSPKTSSVLANGICVELDPSLGVDSLQLNNGQISELALAASKTLNLDAIQAYFLIVHYSSARRDELSDALCIDLHELEGFYYKERLHMLKCLELMIQDGEASPFWSVTLSMVDESLDGQVATDILTILQNKFDGCPGNPSRARVNDDLQPDTETSSPKLSRFLCERRDAVHSSEGFNIDTVYVASAELGNLMDLLLAIWDDPSVSCTCSQWLQLAQAFDTYLFPISVYPTTEVESTIVRAQELASLILVQGLHLEEILQQMYCTETSLSKDAIFSRPSQGPTEDNAHSHSMMQRDRQPVLKRRIDGVAEVAPKPCVESPVVKSSACGRGSKETFSVNERSKISQLLGTWSEGNTTILQAPIFLGWAAFLVLHDSVSFDNYSDPAETWKHIELFSGSAWACGGFVALLNLAKSDGLRVDYNLASACLAAYGISPLTLSAEDLDTMLQTTYHLFSNQPDLCSMFWDVNSLAKEPMYHFLNVARDIFPAIPMPLIYLLAGVCNGPQNATQVHNYLARLPSLTFQHSLHDPDITISGLEHGGRVHASVSKPIKEIPMLSIPRESEGLVVFCTAVNLSPHAVDIQRRVKQSTQSEIGIFPGRVSDADRVGTEAILSKGNPACMLNEGLVGNRVLAESNDMSACAQLSALQTSTLLTKIEGLGEESKNCNGNVLIRWSVEPPKGTGMVKVLLQVAALSKQLRLTGHGPSQRDLTVTLRLVLNMAMADSSTGKELLKYEVHEDTYTLNKHLSEPCHAPLARHRVTLLSLVCRVLDDIMHLEEPNLDCMGLCLSICASLASHAPGEVMQQLMSTEFLESYWTIPLTVDASQLENKDTILDRFEGSSEQGLPRFRKLHRVWEVTSGSYPVTLGLLEVLGVALHKGVTSGVMTEAIGYVLPTVLSQTLHAVFSRPEQKHQISEQCIRVLRRGLQTVMSAARYARSNEEVDHRIAFVQALEAFITRKLVTILPSAFPPPATVLETNRVASSDLVVTKSLENLAKEVLSFVSALDQSQDIHEVLFFQLGQNARPCAAACLSSYLTYSHSDLKMRLLALQAIKVFLELISGSNSSNLTYRDLLISDLPRGADGNHALWRNTLVQSTGLVMAGIDTAVCCAAMECVKWSVSNHHALMDVLLFPTLLEKKESMGVLPWARKGSQLGVSSWKTSGLDATAESNSEAELQPLSGRNEGSNRRQPYHVEGTNADSPGLGVLGVNPTASMSTSTLSVIDCLWDLLQDAPHLLKDKPQSIAMALQVLSAIVQSANLSVKHREAAEILKRQPGFWSCVASCVPARQTSESDREPERSQHLAERAALLTMAVELSNYLRIPPGFKRCNYHKELLEIMRGWEREGWRGRSARINQLLMEREGTNIQEVGQASSSFAAFCNPSKSCVCLGIVVMILVIIIVFQQSST